MNKTKLLSLLVIILILLNISLIGFFLSTGPNRRPPHNPEGIKPKEIIIERLHLDSKQQESYSELIEQEKKEVQSLEEEGKTAREQLYSLLSKPSINEKTKDSLLVVISNNQNKIETNHFNHFLDIKHICRGNQINEFNKLTSELARIFSKNKRPPHRD